MPLEKYRYMSDIEKYGSLRTHQREGVDVARDVLSGVITDRVIVAAVTPGGGKTLMAALFADVLFEAGDIEQVIVVVPNKPLAHQMQTGFHNPSRGLDRYLGARSKKRREGSGPSLPGMGQPSGRVVTYQSIFTDASDCLRRAKRKRTLLILDEPHHLADNKAWAKAIEPIVQCAHRVLMMSGTLSRDDGARIPFIAYDDEKHARVHIRYSRRMALTEHAVLSINVTRYDGDSTYEHRGQSKKHELSSAPAKEQARALKTALLTPAFVDRIVLDALRDWSRYRREKYASKAIIVAHTQKAARRITAVVSRNFPEAHVVLAVCDEPTADQAIKDFRIGHANVLVTVRKAYEGLDVPSATHLVYLGDARTFGFLDQVIARVTRVNPDCGLTWKDQEARVYVPDDKRSRDYLDRLLDEQVASHGEAPPDSDGEGTGRRPSDFGAGETVPTDVGHHLNALSLDPELSRMLDEAQRSSASFAAMPLHHQISVINSVRGKKAS